MASSSSSSELYGDSSASEDSSDGSEALSDGSGDESEASDWETDTESESDASRDPESSPRVPHTARSRPASAQPAARVTRRWSSSSSSEAGSPVVQSRKSGRARIEPSSSEGEAAAAPAQPVQAASSSDENDESEVCSICLLRLKAQEIGVPDACEHRYCAECLIEWSLNVSTCPIDRRTMRRIQIWQAGERVRVHTVARKTPNELVPDDVAGAYFDDTCFCEVCRSGERGHTLLLCDGCDLGYHTTCLDPPLSGIPRGRWFCPTCVRAGVGGSLTPPICAPVLPLRRPADAAGLVTEDAAFSAALDFVPRTGEMARIQRSVQTHRRQVAQTLKAATPAQPRRTKKKTRTRKKPKARKKTSTTGTKKTRKSPKKKSTSRRKSTRKGKGQGKGKSSRSRKARDEADDSLSKKSDPSQSLSLFGHKNDLDFFGDEDMYYGEPQPSTSGSSAAGTSRASQMLKLAQDSNKKKSTSASSSVDLLGSIMASQAATLRTSATPLTTKLKEVYRKGDESEKPTSAKAHVVARPPSRKPVTPSESAVARLAKIKAEAANDLDLARKRQRLDEDTAHSASGSHQKPNVKSSATARTNSAHSHSSQSSSNSHPKTPRLASDSSRPKSSSWPSGGEDKRKVPTAPSASPKPSSSGTSSAASQDDGQRIEKLTKISLLVKKYLKPYAAQGKINRDDYKNLLRRSTARVYKDSRIYSNPHKVRVLVDKYIQALIASH